MARGDDSAKTAARRPRYVADEVFDALAREILRGDLQPGEPLPPERALSERFAVSKLLVRQAIHRLAAAELVRVRQGDVTRVVDPARSSSLEVIDLTYRLAPESEGAQHIARHVLEKQYTQGLSLLEVFVRRARPDAKRALAELVADATVHDEAAMAALEERFWTFVAREGGNRILEAEVAFWYRNLAARPRMASEPGHALRLAFYVELARRVAASDDALAYYVAALAPSITALFADAPPKPARSRSTGR